MTRMTFKRLYNYNTIVEQIAFIESKEMPEQLKGIDYSKPSVQSNTISKPAEDAAIECVTIEQEYQRLCKEKAELDAFIYDIEDEFTKAIAIQRFIYEQSYPDIARSLLSNRNKVSKTLKKYIKNSAE
jgi:hypothetical protein